MTFTPTNPFEEKLAACCAGELELAALVPTFLESQVFVLLDGDIPAGNPHLKANPLVLDSPKGYPVLAIFSRPECATRVAQAFPQFPYGLLVECRWLLRQIKSTVGIAVNPGSTVGFEMPPEGFARFKRDFGLSETAN